MLCLFFVPCGTFLIAHDSKCSRPISVVRCIVQGRSQEFVDVRNLVMGYVMGYLSTISEKKRSGSFVQVRQSTKSTNTLFSGKEESTVRKTLFIAARSDGLKNLAVFDSELLEYR